MTTERQAGSPGLQRRRERRAGRWLAGALAGLLLTAATDQGRVAEQVLLEKMLEPAEFWAQTPDEFMSGAQRFGFRWLSGKETARAAYNNMEFSGLKVWEVQARCESNRVSQITYSLYNRGDAGELSAKSFETLLAQVQQALSQWAGVTNQPLPEVLGPARMKIQRATWSKTPHRLELEWSVTKAHIENGRSVGFRAEFIRLKLLSAVAHAAPRAPPPVVSMTTARTKLIKDLRAHLRREANGDVYLADVPMVDQGPKGYCAAAVTERVMRYYGLEFDQHQVAQVAGTTASGGTSGQGLREALKRIAVRNNLRVSTLQEMKVQDYQRLITDYNRLAAQAKQPKLEIDQHMLDVNSLYQQADGELLRKVRLKRTTDMNQFKVELIKQIEAGIPVIWDVMLGKVAEQGVNPQAGGGHLRLLIGYNTKTGEVLYSDTWGLGHELKRLPLADAWTMTTATQTMKPVSM